MKTLKSKSSYYLLCLFLTALLAMTPFISAAADVSMGQGEQFSPEIVAIGVGESVTWHHIDGATPHNVAPRACFFSGFGSPGLMYQPETYTYTFDRLGACNYMCTIHPAMLGTVFIGSVSTTTTTTTMATSTTTTTVRKCDGKDKGKHKDKDKDKDNCKGQNNN